MRIAPKQPVNYYQKQKQLLEDLARQNAYMKALLTEEQQIQMNIDLWPNLYKNHYAYKQYFQKDNT